MAENPGTNALRQGFGVTFSLSANGGDWIHRAIPTPVIVEDRRATLDRVLILFDARETSALAAVHVWDGPDRILVREGLRIEGDHAHGLSADNVFPVGRDAIRWGCGISMLRQRAQGGDSWRGELAASRGPATRASPASCGCVPSSKACASSGIRGKGRTWGGRLISGSTPLAGVAGDTHEVTAEFGLLLHTRADGGYEPGTSYHLKVEANGPRIRVCLGAEPVIDVTDTATGGGYFGIDVWNGTGTIRNATVG